MADWEVLALHYGTAERPATDLALEADSHDRPGRIDYFVWLVRGPSGLFLVDTGFGATEGAARGRTLLMHPVAALAGLGVRAEDVTDVVLTHLHYDHAGNIDAFPNARFHIQDREMAYGTGRCMCHARMRKPFAVDPVVDAVRLVFAGRMCFHDGDAPLAEGVSLHLVGGHSRGLQVVRIARPEGVVVLASDTLHFSAYLTSEDVFPMFADYADVVEGYRTLRTLAGPAGIIVPGHDPSVLTEYPALSPATPYARVIR